MRLGELFKNNAEARKALDEFCAEQVQQAHAALEDAEGSAVTKHQAYIRAVRELKRAVKKVLDEEERNAHRTRR